MSRQIIYKSAIVLIIGALTLTGGLQLYQHRHFQTPIIAGPGVTKINKLSEYAPGLKGTMADTNVFFLEGSEPGGKILVIANTHSNEPSALLSSLIFLENAAVEKGTLIIIAQFLHTEDGDDILQVFITLQDFLDPPGNLVVFIADDVGIEDAAR